MAVMDAEPLKTSDLVTLFVKARDSIHTLWNFYMAASFGAVAVAATKEYIQPRLALAAFVGYVCFLLGHLALLRNTILVERAIGRDLDTVGRLEDKPQFGDTLRTLLKTQQVWWQTVMIHLSIDACVLGMIWSRDPHW